MKKSCPICKHEAIVQLYKAIVPALQNKVYELQSDALTCPQGKLDLAFCQNCNFTFNSAFDENLIVYDEDYDNAVPSRIFSDYYSSICNYLYRKYQLENGVVYDIGCGKGTFLKMLCSKYPSITGIGIDPTYEGDLHPMKNLNFIREFFKHEHVTTPPNLILSRHVFEHIEFPGKFLNAIIEPIRAFNEIPIFIEVPDFQWIAENETFWDLCYEHCNYFSEKSLVELFNNPWTRLSKITASFNGQYLWVEGILNPFKNESYSYKYNEINITNIQKFVGSINDERRKIQSLLVNYKNNNFLIAVWGMATKGVIFTNNVDRENVLIDYCIDINQDKQNKYSPLSGHLIQSPSTFDLITNSKIVIVIMNTNYVEEIRSLVEKHSNKVIFIDAHGTEI